MSNEARVGLFVFIVILVFIGLSIKIGELSFTRKSVYPITMVFTTVEGLKTGALVELAGVKVGKVTDITLNRNFSANVAVEVYDTIKVPIDSTASIGTKGVLGDKIVLLSPGVQKETIKPNGNLARTSVPPSIDYLVTRVGEISSNLSELTASLNDALGGEEGVANLKGIVQNLNNLTEQTAMVVSSSSADITQTVASLKVATENIAYITMEMSNTSQNLSEMAEYVKSGKGNIGMLLYDDTLYLSILDSVTRLQGFTEKLETDGTLGKLISDDTLYNNLASASESLKTISEDIASGKGTLGRLIFDDQIYLEINEAIKNINRAAEGIHEQTPVTIMGTILGMGIR